LTEEDLETTPGFDYDALGTAVHQAYAGPRPAAGG
jgi:hypothetical protein